MFFRKKKKRKQDKGPGCPWVSIRYRYRSSTLVYHGGPRFLHNSITLPVPDEELPDSNSQQAYYAKRIGEISADKDIAILKLTLLKSSS